jgi:transcription elongation factor GreA
VILSTLLNKTMDTNFTITPYGHEALKRKQAELSRFLSKKSNDYEASQKRIQLVEIQSILEKASVVEFDENTPASVQIGAKVLLENMKNGDKREYTILSRATADPLKGVISNESPLAQKMMGFKLGNTFKFKDIAGTEDSYKIVNIE